MYENVMFKSGAFVAASGQSLAWKVECDSMSDEDWTTLASLVARRVSFGKVEGVPRGGVKFAEALKQYADPSSKILLIVDDVITTGGSMEKQRRGRNAVGIVAFARGTYPQWIAPIFFLNPWFAKCG